MTTLTKTENTRQILTKVLRELHGLRNELSVVLPQENLKDYKNVSRVKQSYQKALKKYPIA